MTADIAKISTTPGHAIPPFPRHAITTHLPTWQAVLDFADRKPEIMTMFKSMYPRMMLHRDVIELAGSVLKFAKAPEGQTCFLYPSLEAAESQVKFSTDPRRKEAMLKKEDLNLRVFDIDVRYYAVFFDAKKTPMTMPFWTNAGIGVSSRMAEQSLQHIDQLKEVSLSSVFSAPPPANGQPKESSAEYKTQERIASLLERAPVGGARDIKVKADDVYFFQTGMAAIWWVHEYLIGARNGTSILYGYAFHSTPHVLEDFGPAYKLFGNGSTEELDELESFLETEKKEGRKVQAIWAEFPANPMLTIPDLSRLRKLADTYDVVLCVDDTVGSFCNVDVMGADGADIVLTSLTKSFSGYADVMGGSAVLNPLTKSYSELKEVFTKRYHNDVCPLDLEALEHNSRDYLERSKAFNYKAEFLVNWLEKKAKDPNSAVKEVMYPSCHPQRPNYDARKRPTTAEFEAGYGCLFSVEFDNVPETIAFYDTMSKYIHIGPHLGAHRTLVLCYVKAIYAKGLDHVAPFGLHETAIRVSVGSEDDPEQLLEVFKIAVAEADALKAKSEDAEKAPTAVASVS
ncbi:cystathionine gamma-synthase, converts cysteine into cystathionine [Rhizodiscina lignyota]|uniref:Cystathionine gamma-synthase, converts cysteine into cystathionine n=1 Tax=Rhizodiscina lignyota TaxID=1504668 RepID=A0A9P4I6V4_9PEZI|nr:cystathionine gamma-synthase, converts cysteine into cystathionine [Rhizodiscina lignyota]